MTTFVPFAFAVTFPFFWIAICLLLSRLSGWSSLATHYGTDTKPDGERYGSQSMGLGFSPLFMVSYSTVVNVYMSETHLYLTPKVFFKAGHRPLSIPLGDIKSGLGRVLFFKVTKLEFEHAKAIKGHVFGILGESLMKVTSRL